MFALLRITALCLAVDAAPAYTVHLREITMPERVVRVPLVNSETVLDAVHGLKRLTKNLDQMDIWVTRPGLDGKVQVLRIDWVGITNWGNVSTNFQLLKGDRLFLQVRPAQ